MGSHLEAPAQRGHRGAVWLGPGLTCLGEKVLDLGNGGLGLHLGEAQAGDKSAVAGSLEGQGPRISLGEVGWPEVLDNYYGRGRVGDQAPQPIQPTPQPWAGRPF